MANTESNPNAVEIQAEIPAENTPSKRQMAIERMRMRNSELQDDDDLVFGEMLTMFDEYDQKDSRINELSSESQKLVDLLNKDPRLSHVIMAIKNGGNALSTLIEQYGDDFKEAIDNPDFSEELAESHAKYLERITKSKELDDIAEKNIAQSMAELAKYQEENNLTDEQAQEILSAAYDILDKGISGLFDASFFSMIAKMLNYDEAVREANEVGQIAGRNQNISDLKLKESKEDATPALQGSNAAPQTQKPKKGWWAGGPTE